MSKEYIDATFERDGGVAILTLNRPEARNALSTGIRNSILHAAEEANTDDSIKVLIVTGAGTSFCAGADVKNNLQTSGSRRGPIRASDGRKGILGPTPYPMQQLAMIDKPTIAAVNGPAVGAGLGLALCCDIRIAARSARLMPVFVKRGLVPDSGVSYFLPRIVGMAKALEIMWSGDDIGAEEALALGIVSRVTPDEELLSATKELAHKIAGGPSVAIELTKRLCYAGMANTLPMQIAYESYCSLATVGTEDFEEGVRAFVEKRRPVFTGM